MPKSFPGELQTKRETPAPAELTSSSAALQHKASRGAAHRMAKQVRQQRRAEQRRLLSAATSNTVFTGQDPSPVMGTAQIPDRGGELELKTPKCAPRMQESAPSFA